MRIHASIKALGLVLVSGLLLAACTSEPAPGAAGASTVRLLTHDSFVVSQALIDKLKADTGITLEVVTAGDAGAMVAGAVLASGSPSGDVMFGIDNTLLSKAVDADVFSAYTAGDSTQLITGLQDDTAGGLVTPIDYGDVCVNIDDRWFAKHHLAAPTSLDQLAAPEYQDLLVVEDPASSSPGLAFMLATIAKYGDGWAKYWERLDANGVKVSGSWTDAYESVFSGGKGDRPLVVSYATSPPAEIVYSEDPKPSKPSTSVMTEGCYRQIEFAGVLRGTANEAGARKVVDWLLSAPVQADVPLSMFVFPARADVPLPEVFTRFAAKVADPLQLTAQDVNAHLDEWLRAWGQVMGR